MCDSGCFENESSCYRYRINYNVLVNDREIYLNIDNPNVTFT